MKYIVRDYDDRFFIGLEHIPSIQNGNTNEIPALWDTFLKKAYPELNQNTLKHRFIGLECYPPDFMETKEFDYFALVETNNLIEEKGFVSKKLPKGKYISFEITFDNIHEEIKNVYQYIKEHKVDVHFGFDFEEYLEDQDYTKEGAILYFTLKLENH